MEKQDWSGAPLAFEVTSPASIFMSLASIRSQVKIAVYTRVLLLGLAGQGAAWAQLATTTPVGIVTVAPGSSAVTTPLFFYYGPPLAQAAVYEGRFTAMAGAVLTDSGASWTVNQFNPAVSAAARSHYIEVTSGVLQGTSFDVLATAASTITADFSFGNTSVVGSTYVIRPHRTIASLFGVTNQAGLRAGTELTADLIRLWDGVKYLDFFYSSAAGGPGWRKVGDGVTDHGGRVIKPKEGILFKFTGGTSPTLALMGELQGGVATILIAPGANFVNPVASIPLTLGTSNLFTNNPATGLKAGAPTTADVVSLFNGAAFDDYYVRSTAAGVQGWRKAGDVATDRSAVVIPPGTAFIVKRTGDPRAFSWKRPSLYTPPSS